MNIRDRLVVQIGELMVKNLELADIVDRMRGEMEAKKEAKKAEEETNEAESK